MEPREKGTKLSRTTETLRSLVHTHPPNHKLPTESTLMKTMGLSRGTVRMAFERLVSEGLIYRQRRKGSFVSEKAKQLEVLFVINDNTENAFADYWKNGLLIQMQKEIRQAEPSLQISLLTHAQFRQYTRQKGLQPTDFCAVVFFFQALILMESLHLLKRWGLPAIYCGFDCLSLPKEQSGVLLPEDSIAGSLLSGVPSGNGGRIVLWGRQDSTETRHRVETLCRHGKARGMKVVDLTRSRKRSHEARLIRRRSSIRKQLGDSRFLIGIDDTSLLELLPWLLEQRHRGATLPELRFVGTASARHLFDIPVKIVQIPLSSICEQLVPLLLDQVTGGRPRTISLEFAPLS